MVEEQVNPFEDPATSGGIQLVTQIRLYDLLMALLTNIDEEKAVQIYNLHLQGKTLYPPPNLEVEW